MTASEGEDSGQQRKSEESYNGQCHHPLRDAVGRKIARARSAMR